MYYGEPFGPKHINRSIAAHTPARMRIALALALALVQEMSCVSSPCSHRKQTARLTLGHGQRCQSGVRPPELCMRIIIIKYGTRPDTVRYGTRYSATRQFYCAAFITPRVLHFSAFHYSQHTNTFFRLVHYNYELV